MTAEVAVKKTRKSRKAKSEEQQRALKLAAAKKILERRRAREWALANTVNFSRLVGLNPYDFRKQQVMYVPGSRILPWCPYAEKAAAYFDCAGVDVAGRAIAKPKKPVFIARDHFKTTIAECALARRILAHPELSYMVFSDKEDNAQARLSRVAGLLLHPRVQELFVDIVYPYAKEYYQSGSITIQRPKGTIHADQAAVLAVGILSGFTGLHCNGVIWFDDIVTRKNYKQSDVQESLWVTTQDVMSNVASPGCELWFTGTRYHMADMYRNILDHDSPIKQDIVPGSMVIGCTEPDGKGGTRPLNFLRFCMDVDDETRPVTWRGVRFDGLTRESLLVKKQNTRPLSEWYAQMENNPTPEENAFFTVEEFEHIVPCKAMELVGWLSCAEAQVMLGEAHGPLQIAVLGDPAYGGKDNAVVLVAAMDREGRIYLMNGFAHTMRDLKGYFMKALEWRDQYGVTCPLGIEIHAKESSRTLCEEVARQMGVRAPMFYKLTDNACKTKEARIQTLASYLVGGKLWFCDDFPADVRRRLIDEAMQFPNGAHDDIVDTLANAVQVFNVRRGTGKPVCLSPAMMYAPKGVRRFLR